MRIHLFVLFVIGVSACGDRGTEGPGGAGVDGNANEPDACADQDCRVAADYADLGSTAGIANRVQPDSYLIWHTNIEGECRTENVLLWADLMGGKGALSDGIAPGTYELAEADFSMDTCGACIRMVGGDEPDARCYLASGGTLVLAEVDERLSGQLESVTFSEIRCEDFAPIDSDCTSRIGSLAFDAEYVFTD